MKKALLLLWIIILAFLALAGCTEQVERVDSGKAQPLQVANPRTIIQKEQAINSLASNVASETQIEVVTEYGNGLYYFNCVGSNFGRKLSLFLKKNTNLLAISIAGEVTNQNRYLSSQCDYGSTVGYWVLTKEKDYAKPQ